MKVVELICKLNGPIVPQVYTVGTQPMNSTGVAIETMGIIASIRYNRIPYNKGYQGDYPSYTVEFVNSDLRTIIPESGIVRVGIDIEKGKKDDDTAPELPPD